MAEADDAGIAQDQVEREREERQDDDLVEDQQLAGKQEEGRDGQEPEGDLRRMPAARAREGFADAPLQIVAALLAEVLTAHDRDLAKRPSGRTSSSTTISA